MGIAFQLDRSTRKRYLGFGIDLAEVSGEDHGQLPVPSVFLVSAEGEILWVYSNPDYKIRPNNDHLMKAARKAAPKSIQSAEKMAR